MTMSIRTNLSSLNAQRNLFQTGVQLESSLSKLSSGYRITKAGDDAAGLAISSNFEAQIKSYNQASRNAQDGLSMVQTAEGGLNEVTNILSRLRELAMQSASDGVTDTERGYIQEESDVLTDEIDRIANATEFNNTKLLNSGAGSLVFQVGIRNNAANDQLSVATVDATTNNLGVNGLDVSTRGAADTALDDIDAAIESVSSMRSGFGAAGNRLSSAVSTIQTASESLSAANMRIRDVDVAEETSKMARANVLMQAGVSVLAQANQAPQMALKLLG